MNNNKKIFLITLTFIMLAGLTTISAMDINTNDTTAITQTSQANTINYDTTSTNEASTGQRDNIQETTNSETINEKTGTKTQNLKAGNRTETATNFNDLKDYLTSSSYDTVTIDITDDIQLADSLDVNNAIKTLTINGNGKTIDGNNQYYFLHVGSSNVTIKNLTIVNCSPEGGAAIDNEGTVTIYDSILANNFATQGGGAIHNNYGNLTIHNSILENNTVGDAGGAIYNNGGNLIINSSILNNNSAAEGGAGAIFNDGNLTIISTTIENNSGIEGGGAIFNSEGSLNITDSVLNNNNVTYYGGAIYIWYTNVTIHNTTLDNNTSNAGGAIYNFQSNLNIINSTLNNNNANNTYSDTSGRYISWRQLHNYWNATSGGAIFNHGNLIINNCNFTKNNASIGGAILTNQSTVNINNSIFEENVASINSIYDNMGGGAIYSTNSTVTIDNGIFTGNVARNITINSYSEYAHANGGAICADNGNISLIKSTLNNNNASSGGGAICIYGEVNLIINNSNLKYNHATQGGAINKMYGNLTITNSNFTYNTAIGYYDSQPNVYVGGYGGAIDNFYGNLNINASNLNYNSVKKSGGAINNYNSNLNINASNLNYNNAGFRGGAIDDSYSNISITNSILNNNNANESGGAIGHRGNLTINNTILNNNTANNSGGAIHEDMESILTVQNSTLTDNKAESGGAINGKNIVITKSNLINNMAMDGGAICGLNITIINTNLTHNNATPYLGGAIYNNGNLTIFNSTLSNNAVTQYGGAIYGVPDSNITIVDSTLTNNNATLDGGAIYGNDNSNITITNSTFTNNIAYSGGAIMGRMNSTMMINSSNFTNNIGNGFGGAIHGSWDSNITIIDTNLAYNTATYDGGAVDASSKSNLTIINSNLTHNHANNSGGAIGEHTSNVTITNSNLINNTATLNGGAICGQGKITITSSNVTNNHASNGGAIHGHYCNITITNTNVTNNHANETGGVIYDYGYCNISLKNSNIIDNYVTSDIGYVVELHSANSIIITDNIFINNTDNVRDMLFSDATDDVDIHGNSYIDNFMEVIIIEPDVNIVTDNEAGSYDYYIDLNLRDVYNDTVRNGTLNVYVNGVLNDTTNVTNGHARILFGNSVLTKRENNITLEYISESKHYQNTTKNFTVYKEVNTVLTIEAPDMMYSGDTAVINFTLKDVNDNPLGNETIHVLVDEKQVATITTDDNGIATYNFSAFGDEIVRIVGTHHTSSDSFYLSAMDAEADIDVNKIQPEIIIKHDTLIPYVETNITIHLFDHDGNPIKNKTLTVNITEEGRPDITGTVTTDENGIGVFNFTPVDEGILTVNVTSPVDDIYHYASESVQISRYFITTNLVVDVSTTIINKTNTIHVEVLPDDGALLSGTVELDINGEIHILNITNGRGTYHDYKSSTAGEKLVNAKFTSSNPSYTNATTTEEFNVEKLPTRVTIEAINRTAGNVTLKVQVFPKNNTGSIVNGGNIVIESIDGENSKVIYNSTLINGELIYLTDINETGWYEFETEYHGNDYFLGEINNTGSLEILLVDTNTVTYDKTALVGDTITLNATVNDKNGNLVNGNVTFLVDGVQLYHADGTPVEAKLENGTATTEYTLPTTYQAGKYIIKANYQGNNKYNISSGESELKVQSNSTVTVDAVEGLVLDNVTFTANIRDYHDNPVTGGYVVFKVSGKTLTYDNGTQIRTPVVNGIAQLSYMAESGWIVDSHPNLTVEATYSGTGVILSGRSDISKVTIYKRNATVTVSAPDDYVNGTLHIDAVVKDQNGSFINDGVLVFKLNGLSLKYENNKGIVAKVVNGRVHIDVKLPFAYSAKKYNLTATYSNKIYNKASGTNTTSLKAIPTYMNATVTIKDQFSKPVVTGQIYNKFNNAILEGTAVINIKFDGISYAKKVKINNGTFRETLEGIPIYKPGTHKIEIAAGANSHYDAVRKTITSKATPKYNVNTIFTNITRNKTTTRVQAKIVDDKNKNVQRDLRITIKLNGKSFLVNKTVTNGKVDVFVDTSTLKNRNYTLELVSGANTYYNAGKNTTELPKY